MDHPWSQGVRITEVPLYVLRTSHTVYTNCPKNCCLFIEFLATCSLIAAFLITSVSGEILFLCVRVWIIEIKGNETRELML